MRLTIDKLRTGVLLGGSGLVAVLLLVLGWAHLRARKALRDLPAQLGADIQREANGFTYSQTVGGRVVYTLHAKRATQRTGGTAQLEDAGLVLYGDGDGRADRIYGSNFLYDQGAGLVKAVGAVQLDLAAPAPSNTAERIGFASGGAVPTRKTADGRDEEPVHATTSGLSYQQSTGLVTTVEHVAFRYGGMEGEAEGASYSSRDGMLVLDRAVVMRGRIGERDATVHALHAEVDRVEGRVALEGAQISAAGGPGGRAEYVRAAQLLLRQGEAGKLEQAEGDGGVELADADGTAKSTRALLRVKDGGLPESLRMWDGVDFVRTGAFGGSALRGTARESASTFDGRGRLETERLMGDVVVHSDGQNGERRVLTGERVELVVAEGRELREATAEGNAKVRSTGAIGVESGLEADRLRAEFVGGKGELERVTGTGSAVLRREAPGLAETSHAPTVVAEFGQAQGGAAGGGTLSKVEESGGVVIDRELRGEISAHKRESQRATSVVGVERMHAVASEATYDAGKKQGVLVGNVVVSEPDRMVKAERVVLRDDTGDAEAEGAVQASLKPETTEQGVVGAGREAEWIHAVGTRVFSKRDDGSVTVWGGDGRDARMWQSASQVEAPVLVLRQAQGTMDAFGEGAASGEMVVKTVLAHSSTAPTRSGDPARGGAGGAQVIRVRSGRLHFVNGTGIGSAMPVKDGERKAEFTGGVLLESQDGTMRAMRAVATLRAGGGAAQKTVGAGMGMSGGLEKVVAQGGVELDQPGRQGTGSELVWTAADQAFVLTGTPTVPPTVTDAANGTVTGGEIRFHGGDSSVEVVGSAPGSKDGRVHTTTRLGSKE